MAEPPAAAPGRGLSRPERGCPAGHQAVCARPGAGVRGRGPRLAGGARRGAGPAGLGVCPSRGSARRPLLADWVRSLAIVGWRGCRWTRPTATRCGFWRHVGRRAGPGAAGDRRGRVTPAARPRPPSSFEGLVTGPDQRAGRPAWRGRAAAWSLDDYPPGRRPGRVHASLAFPARAPAAGTAPGGGQPGPTRRCRWRGRGPAGQLAEAAHRRAAVLPRRRAAVAAAGSDRGRTCPARRLAGAGGPHRGVGGGSAAGRPVPGAGRQIPPGFVAAFSGSHPVRPWTTWPGRCSTRQPEEGAAPLPAANLGAGVAVGGGCCDAVTGLTGGQADAGAGWSGRNLFPGAPGRGPRLVALPPPGSPTCSVARLQQQTSRSARGTAPQRCCLVSRAWAGPATPCATR